MQFMNIYHSKKEYSWMMHDDDYLLSLSIITVTSSGNIKINTNNFETSPSNSDAILTIRR